MADVMGIDPSLRRTGICLPSGDTFHIATGEADRGDWRLVILQRQVRYYLRQGPVELAVIEGPGRYRSGDAAIAAGMAQAAIRSVLAEYAVPVAIIQPAVLKLFACGKGNADKAEMVAAANRHRQSWIAIHSARPPFTKTVLEGNAITDDNEADAWWLRQMGLWHLSDCALDPANDSFLHPEVVREKACHGPWPKGQGAKWPGGLRGSTHRGTLPGHPPARKPG